MSTCIIKSVFILYVLRERQSLMIFLFFEFNVFIVCILEKYNMFCGRI